MQGDHGTVSRGLNVYMHLFDFTQGSAGSIQGCCLAICHALPHLESEGQTHQVTEAS